MHVFPHEYHAVKEISQDRRCMHKMREKSVKSQEKMIDAFVRKWHVADENEKAEFIANIQLSRPSFAKVSNKWRPLITN